MVPARLKLTFRETSRVNGANTTVFPTPEMTHWGKVTPFAMTNAAQFGPRLRLRFAAMNTPKT